MKLFLILIKSSWRKLLFGAVISAVAAVLYALAIKMLNELIKSGSLVDSMLFVQMTVYILASTGLAIFAGFYLTNLYEKIVAQLRIDLSQKVLKADFEVVERNAYKILPVINVDVNNIGMFVKTIPDILVAVFKIIVIITYMFLISWEITLYIISIFLLVFILTSLLVKRFLKEERAIQNQRNRLFKELSGLVNGIKELTLNIKHQLGYVKNTIAESSNTYAHHMTRIGGLNIVIIKSAELLVILGLGMIMLLMKSTDGYSNDVFLEILALVLFMLPSLIIVTTFFKGMKRIDVSMEQINSLSLKFDGITEHIRKTPISYLSNSAKQFLRLKKLQYNYSNSSNHSYGIGPIELEIIENEILIIKGGNGSGKTTLSKLICGLYQSKVGEVIFQSQKITRNNLYEYRDLFAAVFADSHVFDDLRYLALDANDPRINYYSKLLDVDDKMVVKDSQISTVDLSFGQRGRLNLLRALLEDKPIYLFDEWAANQDPYFKSKFYTEILPMLKASGKTVIVISHDDQYYHVADRILTLSGGQVERIDVKPS